MISSYDRPGFGVKVSLTVFMVVTSFLWGLYHGEGEREKSEGG